MPFASRLRVYRVTYALLAVVALAAGYLAPSGAAIAGPRGSARPASGCARVLFIGARGSGEYGPGSDHWPKGRDPGDFFGLGGPVNEAYHLVSAGIGFPPVSVDYPAARVQTLLSHPAAYFDSISIGVSFTLTRLIREARLSECPRQPIVLVGYSQGAMVMHRVLRALIATPAYSTIVARIAAVVLIADGDQVPSDNVTRFGTAKITVVGVGLFRPSLSHTSAAPLPAALRPDVLQVCNTDDVVCGWPNLKTVKHCLSHPLECAKQLTYGIRVHLHYVHAKPLIAASHHAAALLAAALGKSMFTSAMEVPGLGALNAVTAQVFSVSCPSAGNCAAGGIYIDTSQVQQAFVASEDNGVWQDAIEVPGTATINAGGGWVNSVSCASAGNCAAGGTYTDIEGHGEAFVAGEVNGVWQDAVEVPGTATLNVGGSAVVESVSCPSPGNCAIGGSYQDSSGKAQAFLASEVNGIWQDAVEVPGTPTLNVGGNALVRSMSCASAGNCAAGGFYSDTSVYGTYQGFVVSEVHGVWQKALEVPGTAALNVGGDAAVESVSCPSAGTCTAGGTYTDAENHGQAFVATEADGTWQKAVEVPGTAKLNSDGNTMVESVSCPSAGNCASGGTHGDASGAQAFVAGEVNGVWQKAVEVPGTAALNLGGGGQVTSVTCATAGNCAVGGSYSDIYRHSQAFVASEVNGAWQEAIEVPGTATLNVGGNAGVRSVSCPAVGRCVAGGYYIDNGNDKEAFLSG